MKRKMAKFETELDRV